MLVYVIFNSLCILCLPSTAEADLEYQWLVDDFVLEKYEDLYLYRLDVRNLLVEEYDDEMEEYSLEGLDEDVLGDIVGALYQELSFQLKDIIPLNEKKEIDRARSSLVAEFEIRGRFSAVDRGLLTNLLLKGVKNTEEIHFLCIIKDAQTDKELLKIQDTKEIVLGDLPTPFASDEEFQELNQLMEFWTRSLAAILSEKKNI